MGQIIIEKNKRKVENCYKLFSAISIKRYFSSIFWLIFFFFFFLLFFFSPVTEFLIQSNVQNLQFVHYIRAVLYPDDRIVIFPSTKVII